MGRTPGASRVPALFCVPGAAPLLLGCTLFAVYCCVPETSHLPWVALAVAALAALEYGGHGLMPWWTASVAVLVAWGGWHGGHYRSSALVGAVFAWWPWVLVWIVHLVARAAGGRASVRAGAVTAATGMVAAIVVARTGALARTLSPAVIAVVVAVVATLPVVAGALAAEHAVWHRLHPRLRRSVADRAAGRGAEHRSWIEHPRQGEASPPT
ncbi:MAG: hypothetical protein ACKO27_10245 [Ilumatobacteraceae bacterium]